jgi:hypothetical protein
MARLIAGCMAAVALVAKLSGAACYVAPSGSDFNSGSEPAPFYSVFKAVALAGAAIFVRGGMFAYTNTIRITDSVAAGARIKLWVYTNEHSFLDFLGMAGWTPIFTNPPVSGSLSFMDPAAANGMARFYRVEEQ